MCWGEERENKKGREGGREGGREDGEMEDGGWREGGGKGVSTHV